MLTVALTLVCFILSIIIHLNCCRRAPHKNLKTRLFLMIAISVFLPFIIMAAILNWPLLLTSSVIYMILLPIYLVFYVSTELVSPSKRILFTVGDKGATKEEILNELKKERFIHTRLDELVESGCMNKKDNYYTLTLSGRKIAEFLKMYQVILGRDIGG